MATRTKILVVDHDLATLSRIYLALVHRNYKTEASDKEEEIAERIKRLKPALVILGKKEYFAYRDKLKTPCIVLVDQEEPADFPTPEDVVLLKKPVQLDVLVHTIEELVY
jgi:hypothetical protein